MDFDRLVEEIVQRVAQKVAAAEAASGASASCGDRPGLLILTQQHGETCHAMLESSALKSCYRTECALLNEYQVDIADYEAVILFNLTNDALAKLANGVCDTPFTKLAQTALLSGKKVFLPQEEIELYRYAETAPKPYFDRLHAQLDLLLASGVVVCPSACLEEKILAGKEHPCTASCSGASTAPKPTGEIRFTKRVLTERDLSAVCNQSIATVRVDKKTIITDLAREYASARRVAIVRE